MTELARDLHTAPAAEGPATLPGPDCPLHMGRGMGAAGDSPDADQAPAPEAAAPQSWQAFRELLSPLISNRLQTHQLSID